MRIWHKIALALVMTAAVALPAYPERKPPEVKKRVLAPGEMSGQMVYNIVDGIFFWHDGSQYWLAPQTKAFDVRGREIKPAAVPRGSMVDVTWRVDGTGGGAKNIVLLINVVKNPPHQ